MDAENQFPVSPGPPGPPGGQRIKRKPVPNSDQGNGVDDARQNARNLEIPDSSYLKPLGFPSRLGSPLSSRPPLTRRVSSNTVPDADLHQSPNRLDTFSPSPGIQRAVTETPPETPPEPSAQSSPSAVQKAYGEARHFLGGLIDHPSESNRHFSILRHSYGIVFYQGSTTSVTVSIFSDAPLPPERTLWLQGRGWTGNTGMRTKAFFRLHDDWLNVTPSVALHADQVDPANERAWQRDIARFRKKTPAKVHNAHRLRETVMARVPVEAGDGYFQLVLCQGMKKKVLCNSPVFRVLSSSMDPSSVRGASLSTLPLELSAMALSSYAQTAARTFLSPAASTVHNKIQPYQPSGTKQTAAEAVVLISNVGSHIGSLLNSAEMERDTADPTAGPDNLDQGPLPPFPMDFKARGGLYTAPPQYNLRDSPMVSITRAPDAVLDRLHGYFMCWARFYQTEEKGKSTWYQSILSVKNIDHSSMSRVDMSHITKRTTLLRFLEDIQLPAQPKLQVRVMCFIRPEMPPPVATSKQQLLEAWEAAAEASLLADNYDSSYAQTVLDLPAWAPVPPPEVLKPMTSQQQNKAFLDKTKDGYATARTQIQKAPLHWIGVRSPMAQKMDQQVTLNGFYIVR